MSKIYVDEIAGIASPSTVAIPGHVIQVVQGTTSTQVENSSSSYIDTGLSVSITPTSSTSKIYITVNLTGVYLVNAANTGFDGQLLRDSTVIYEKFAYAAGYSSSAVETFEQISCVYLDSPSTTSATTYKVQFKNNSGGQRVDVQNGGWMSTIVAMEIAG